MSDLSDSNFFQTAREAEAQSPSLPGSSPLASTGTDGNFTVALRNSSTSRNFNEEDDLVAIRMEEQRVTMWVGWGVMSAVFSVFILGVFLILVRDLLQQYQPLHNCSIRCCGSNYTDEPTTGRQTRRRKTPFNLYLVFLMIPDLVFTGFCGMVCFMNAAKGSYYSHSMCYFQAWFVIFGFTGSSWMNALIASEVYRMLAFPLEVQRKQLEQRSRSRSLQPSLETSDEEVSISPATPLRYEPPTLGKITFDSLCLLGFAAFASSWGILGISWLPHDTDFSEFGLACLPIADELDEYLFFYGLFVFVIFGAPLIYVCLLCYKIWKYHLLPQQGRQRILALFFFRLAAIFLILWAPAVILLFIMGEYISPWVEWFGGAWAHLQGAVSALFILTNKFDIRESLWCCWCWCYARGNGRAISHSVDSHEANCSKSMHHNCSSLNNKQTVPTPNPGRQLPVASRQELPLSSTPSSAAVAMTQQQTQMVWDSEPSFCTDTHLDGESAKDMVGKGGYNDRWHENQIPKCIQHRAQEHRVPVKEDPAVSAKESEKQSQIRAQIDMLLSQGKFADAAKLLHHALDRNGQNTTIISELTTVPTLESVVEPTNAPCDSVPPATTSNVELVNLSMFSESSIDDDALELQVQSVLGNLLT